MTIEDFSLKHALPNSQFEVDTSSTMLPQKLNSPHQSMVDALQSQTPSTRVQDFGANDTPVPTKNHRRIFLLPSHKIKSKHLLRAWHNVSSRSQFKTQISSATIRAPKDTSTSDHRQTRILRSYQKQKSKDARRPCHNI